MLRAMLPTEMELRDRLAYAIRRAMEAQGMTPADVAAAIGKDARTVKRWANGENDPSVLDIVQLADAIGVSPRLFVDLPPVPLPPEYPIEEYLAGAIDQGAVEGVDRSQLRRDLGDE